MPDPSLQDDIARIAALRGRSADTQALIDDAERLKRRVAWSEIDGLFAPNPDARADIAAYDELPERLRACFREAATLAPMNAVAALNMLTAGVPVDTIIGAVQQRLNATGDRL